VAYFPDLSPCPYFGPAEEDKLVAVGWLEEAHAYTQGKVSEDVLDKLFDLLVRPWTPSYLMGYAGCPWCGEGFSASCNDRLIDVGTLNLFVPDNGFLYVMPSLAAHYILSHNYLPPTQFQQAVLHCPPMRSKAYFEAIAAQGPQWFADIVRKKYLTGE
jgi:hypothetical protein